MSKETVTARKKEDTGKHSVVNSDGERVRVGDGEVVELDKRRYEKFSDKFEIVDEESAEVADRTEYTREELEDLNRDELEDLATEEFDIDLGDLDGSGKDGAVLVGDIENAILDEQG